jgi:mycothiol synthase
MSDTETAPEPGSPRQRSLFMRRPDLENLPPVDLPPGYRLRTAGRDDAPALSGVLSAAFEEAWDEGAVYARLFDDATVAAVYLVEREGEPERRTVVATASSRLLPDDYPGSGYLHWVGADPAEKGRRLGYHVTLAVLHDFAGRGGLADSVLETDDHRLPAIATYLRCGYVPKLREPTDEARWDAVRQALRPAAVPFPPYRRRGADG